MLNIAILTLNVSSYAKHGNHLEAKCCNARRRTKIDWRIMPQLWREKSYLSIVGRFSFKHKQCLASIKMFSFVATFSGATVHKFKQQMYGRYGYIEDICLFQCKIEIYFTEWTLDIFSCNCNIFMSGIATSENIKACVQEWNIIWSYM